jgi:putative ABC transport system substrate-binding protein
VVILVLFRFTTVVALLLFIGPIDGEAQPAGKVYRVGLIFDTSPVSEMAGSDPIHPGAKAFVHGLRALGYVEGQNLILERRSTEGKFERAADIINELVRLKIDVIVTAANRMTQQAKATTTTIPIVMIISTDPVGAGLVSSLAHPGGNITGLTMYVDPEIDAKRLELLKEIVPRASRVAYLGMKEDCDAPWGRRVRAAAEALGLTLVLAEHAPNDFADAFALLSRVRLDALFVSLYPPAFTHRRLIVDFATRNRLPSTHAYREAVELGGLMSYGVHATDLPRRAAGYVDKILKGAKPSDLPIEQPTKFELVINTRTAKLLGLTIPPSLLLRADQIIE